MGAKKSAARERPYKGMAVTFVFHKAVSLLFDRATNRKLSVCLNAIELEVKRDGFNL